MGLFVRVCCVCVVVLPAAISGCSPRWRFGHGVSPADCAIFSQGNIPPAIHGLTWYIEDLCWIIKWLRIKFAFILQKEAIAAIMSTTTVSTSSPSTADSLAELQLIPEFGGRPSESVSQWLEKSRFGVQFALVLQTGDYHTVKTNRRCLRGVPTAIGDRQERFVQSEECSSHIFRRWFVHGLRLGPPKSNSSS